MYLNTNTLKNICIYRDYIDCNYNNFHKKNIKYL